MVPRSLWCGEGGAVGGGRGRLTRGMQAHFPSGDRIAFISRKAGLSLLPVYLKATEIARRLQGGAVHSYTGRTTAIDFPDRLKRRVKLCVCAPNRLANSLGLRSLPA